MDLDKSQDAAVELITDPERGGRVIGYAGTGKTTVIGAAMEQLQGGVILLAPTNKAAAVLARKTGREAATIHRTTHVAVEVWDDQLEAYRVRFVPKDWSEVPPGHKIVIDEASMIGEYFWNEALQVLGGYRKVVMVGDGFQLPPIGEPAAFELLKGELVELTTVYRQEEGSAVLEFATAMRDGAIKAPLLSDHFPRINPTNDAFLAAAYHGAAVCISYTNDVRMGIIRSMRERLWGTPYAPPQKGEPMISYSSSPVNPLKNGFKAVMTEDATTDIDGTWKCRMRGEDGEKLTSWISPDEALDPRQKQTWYQTKVGAPITFAYAMTAHAAQGSQWPIVAIESNNPLDVAGRRWLYTAVTRAQEEVYCL